MSTTDVIQWTISTGNSARDVGPSGYSRAYEALNLLAELLPEILHDPDMPADQTIHYTTASGQVEVCNMHELSITNPEARRNTPGYMPSNYRFGLNLAKRAVVAIPLTEKLGDTSAFQVDLTRKTLDRATKEERKKLLLVAQELHRALKFWWTPPPVHQR